MITKKFLRRDRLGGKKMREALKLCDAYISVRLEDEWRPGSVVKIYLQQDLVPLLKPAIAEVVLSYELVDRLRDAGWDVTHNLATTCDFAVISIS